MTTPPSPSPEPAQSDRLLHRPGRATVVAIAIGLLALGGAATALATHQGVSVGTRPAPAGHAGPFALVWRLFLALAVIGVLAAIGARIAAALAQPRIIGELLAGLVLGPSALGSLAPGVVGWLLPPQVVTLVNLVGTVSLVLYMFAVGREVDARWFRVDGAALGAAALALVALPFALGVGVALGAEELLAGPDVSTLAYALFIGTAMSVTAFPVLARLVAETGLAGQRLGNLALTCAAGTDVLAWAALAFTMAVATNGSAGSVAASLGGTAVVVAVAVGIVRPAAQRWVVRLGGVQPFVAPTIAVVLGTVLALAAITHRLGVHAILGAFVAGLVIPRDPVHVSDIPERMDSLNRSLLLPVYFASVGLQVNAVEVIGSSAILGVGALVLAAAVAGKVVACLGVGWAGGLTLREATGFGVLMNARGVTEIVVLGAGLGVGLINQQAFTVMVVMAVVTTVAVAPLLHLLRIGRGPSPGHRVEPRITTPSNVLPGDHTMTTA